MNTNNTTSRIFRSLAAGLAGLIAVGTLTVAPAPAPVSAAAPCSISAADLPLRVGSRNAAVRCVESALSGKRLLSRRYADTYYGTATRSSIKSVQRRARLPITGAVDAATAAALGLVVSAGAPAPAPTPAPAPAATDVNGYAAQAVGAALWARLQGFGFRVVVAPVTLQCGATGRCAAETNGLVVTVDPSTMGKRPDQIVGLLAHELGHAVANGFTAPGYQVMFDALTAAGISAYDIDECVADQVGTRLAGRPIVNGSLYAYRGDTALCGRLAGAVADQLVAAARG